MQILRNRQIQNDPWQLESSDTLPTGDVIVSLKTWQEQKESLLKRPGKLGLVLNSDEPLDGILADLNHFELIALRINTFNDGRNYSKAYWLRQRHGFNGEIRALGDIRRDQIAFMQRCGIDSFELTENLDAVTSMQAFQDFSVIMQPAADAETLIFDKRGWKEVSTPKIAETL